MAPYNMNMVVVAVIVVLLLHFTSLASAQKSKTKWLTLDGNAPLVVARGGFSGLFPDSSFYAYNLALATSVPDVVLWCDVQLTKDGAGICFPDLKLDNSSNINLVYPKGGTTYDVNGVPTSGYFPIDYTLKDLEQVSLTQGIYSRSPDFDGSGFPILTVDDVFNISSPHRLWLNIQHDSFYNQHNLSMSRFISDASKKVLISFISSPAVNFLKNLPRRFTSRKPKVVFRFLDKDAKEPSTNRTYGSLLKNLTFIKTFASGILVPKNYIWPVDATTSYLQPHTFIVANAHKIGLAVYAANFVNDVPIAYDYSYNPVTECLSFIDNGDFSVDGLLSDFPITPSEAIDCFAHQGKSTSSNDLPLVISNDGASGDYPGCTDLSYSKAISDGADVIDCPVQMSKDGIPFCLSSVNLMNSTQVGQTQFRSLIQTVNAIQPSPGIFSFNMNWKDIQNLTPVLSNPFPDYFLYRNPKLRNAGKLISLSEFLGLASNATSVSRVLIVIKHAKYLAEGQGQSVTDAVSEVLEKAGYNSPTAKKVMIQSTDSAVLKAMNNKKYERVYEVRESIRDVLNNTATDIKTFADSVVVDKQSVFPKNMGFLTVFTETVPHLKSFNLSVYVKIFRNEFVSQAYDYYSDPVVEINSFVQEAGISGVITDFPKTAADYKRNLCLKMKKLPPYMSPVKPGQLFQLIIPQFLPPAQAPSALLTADNVTEAPLPAAVKQMAPAPSASIPTKSSPNGQPQIAASALLSCLAMIFPPLLF